MCRIHYLPLLFFQILCLNQAMAAKEIVGWVENARIYPGEFKLKAKLDTGAKTTSLGCESSSYVDSDGNMWVHFTVTNYKGASLVLERRIERMVKIKHHFGEYQKRPVIKLGICLSGTYRETEVNLVDREGMNYQLLIGRSFLEEHFIIDPAITFTTEPQCSRPVISK